MIIGEYIHKLDDKNRISLPSKFRKFVGKKIIVTRGLDSCLFIYPMNEWRKISAKIGELGMGQASRRDFNRFMLAGATEIDIDAIGRMLIPEHLRKFASINDSVVFAGVYNRIEVWDENKWESYKEKVLKQADDIAEKLGDIGAL
jgi:MraZ protein